jgi:hypothetical protein
MALHPFGGHPKRKHMDKDTVQAPDACSAPYAPVSPYVRSCRCSVRGKSRDFSKLACRP